MPRQLMGMIVALVVFTAGSSVTCAQDEDAKAIQGKWKVESAMRNGEKADEPVGDLVTFDGKKITIKSASGDPQPEGITYELDASKSPKHLNMNVAFGDQKLEVKGCYDIKDDTLRICMGQPDSDRPKKIESPAGSDLFVLVMKRVKE